MQTIADLVKWVVGSREIGPNDCGVDAKTVTPNDGSDLPDGPARGLYIGSAGDLTVVMLSGSQCTFPNHPVGYAPLSVTRVLATGTLASGIRAIY